MTRDGRPVTQLTRFHSVLQGRQLFGVIENTIYCWRLNGSFGNERHNLDLVNVPEKKIVPLSFGDIMPGDWIRTNTRSISLVVYVTDKLVGTSNDGEYNFDELKDRSHWQYSQTHGKTWKPLYKEVET